MALTVQAVTWWVILISSPQPRAGRPELSNTGCSANIRCSSNPECCTHKRYFANTDALQRLGVLTDWIFCKQELLSRHKMFCKPKMLWKLDALETWCCESSAYSGTRCCEPQVSLANEHVWRKYLDLRVSWRLIGGNLPIWDKFPQEFSCSCLWASTETSSCLTLGAIFGLGNGIRSSNWAHNKLLM